MSNSSVGSSSSTGWAANTNPFSCNVSVGKLSGVAALALTSSVCFAIFMAFNCSKSLLRFVSAAWFATSSGSSITSVIGVKSFTNCLVCFAIISQSYCFINALGNCTCTPSITLLLKPLNRAYQLFASCAIRTAGFKPALAAVSPITKALIDICFITDITFVSA